MGGMTAGGQFTLHRYTVKTGSGKTNYLIPFGDIHRDSGMCAVDKWLSFCAWASKKPRATFIGVGDYIDFASTSERRIINNPDLHDATADTLQESATTKTNRLLKEMGFMRGKLIGLMEGNHYFQYPDGTTSTQRMCRALDCKYLGVSTFIRLTAEDGTRRLAIDIWAHHGKGASRLVGGSINRVQQMGEAAQADIYIMGHDHKKGAMTSSKLRLHDEGGGLTLQHRKQLYVRSGSFLKGYENDRSSYIADGAMNPTDLGVVKIEFTLVRSQKEGKRLCHIDLHASI